MKISIIIPVYNVERYLRECLDSIFMQSFHDYEVICINDCSLDQSLMILEEYEREHKEIKVINNPSNRGLSYSRNVGLEIAKGKYVAFVDSDDYLPVDALESLYEIAEEKQLEILYFDKKLIYEGAWENQKEYLEPIKNVYSQIYTGRELFVQLSENREVMNPNACTQFFLRGFLEKNNIRFYEGIVHEDFLFYFICAMNASKVTITNKKLYVHRRREGSITSIIDVKRKQSIFVVFIEILYFWKNNKFSEREHRAIKRYIESIYRIYLKLSNLNSDDSSFIFGGPADAFLYEIVSKNETTNYKNIKFTDIELEIIEKRENIWIYGAGSMGIETLRFLQKHHININGFIVSDKKLNPEKILGAEVFQLDEKQIEKEDLFIIAVKSQRQKNDIKEKLEKEGFKNIIFAIK